MKNFLLISAFATLVLGGCKSSQMVTTTDDVYADPVEERAIAKAAAEQKAKEQAMQREREEQDRAKQAAIDKEKEQAASKYYKDPEYTSDDYYDYAYSARINRFHRPIYGAGFYDPFYTNIYTYNPNPALYGTSIYSSYSWGMPSSQFSYYSFGVSSGWGYGSGFNNCGYNYYDPFCPYPSYYGGWGGGYNSWGYNNYMYNSGFYSGYNQGFYNGLNSGYYGYYNKMDPNSNYSMPTYAPRGSSVGSNTGGNRRNEDAERQSMNSERQRYIQSVSEEQNKQPRFTGDRRLDKGERRTENVESGRSSGNTTYPNTNSAPVNNNPGDRRSNSQRVNEQQPGRRESPSHNSERNSGTVSPAPANNGGGRSNSGGGGSSPRGSNTGGNSRPR